MTKSLLNIGSIFAALAFLAGLLAPNHYFPWAAFWNEVPVGFALLPLAFWSLFADRNALWVPHYIWALLLLPAVPLLQYAGGLIHFRGDALVACTYLSGAVAAYISGYVLSKSPQCGTQILLRYLGYLFLIGALISAVLALRQVFAQSGVVWETEIPPGGRPTANLAQPNQLATLILLGFVALIYLRQQGLFGTWSFGVLSLLLGLGLACAQSRAAMLTLLLLSAWVYWKLPADNAEQKRLRRDAIVFAVVALMLWWGWPLFYGIWSGREGMVRTLQDPARLAIWRHMSIAILSEPWFGYGWGQVATAGAEISATQAGVVYTESAHNLILDLLIWNGIPLGMGGFVALTIWGGKKAFSKQTAQSWFAITTIGVAMVHAMLEFPLHYAYFLLPLSLLAGSLDAEGNIKTLYLPRALMGGLVILGTILLFGITLEYSVAENQLRQFRFEKAGLVLSDEDTQIFSQRLHFLTQLDAFVQLGRGQVVEGMTDEQLENMRVTAHRFPMSPALARYALALALNDHVEAARLEMQRLRNIWGEKHYAIAKEQLLAMQKKYPKLALLALP